MKLMDHETTTGEFDPAFDRTLDQTLAERGAADPPAGFEQRLRAQLTNAAELMPAPNAPSTPPFLSMAGGIKAPRSQASFWTAIGAHAVAIAIIAFLIAKHVSLAPPAPPEVASIIAPATPPPPPPIM